MESNKWYSEISRDHYKKLREKISNQTYNLSSNSAVETDLIEQLIPTSYERKKVIEIFESLVKDLQLIYSKIHVLLKVDTSKKRMFNRFTIGSQGPCYHHSRDVLADSAQHKTNHASFSFCLIFSDCGHHLLQQEQSTDTLVEVTRMPDDYFLVSHEIRISPTAIYFYKCDGLKGLLKNLELIKLENH